MTRLSILVSGDGRYLRPLLDSAFFHEIENLEIAGVISSDPRAAALNKARNLSVPTYVVEADLFPNLASFSTALQNKLRDIDTDVVVLDGFTPALGHAAKYFHGKILGVKLSAVGARMDVAVYVADEQGGVGQSIGSDSVELQSDDTQDAFTRRVYERAEALLMAAVRECCT